MPLDGGAFFRDLLDRLESGDSSVLPDVVYATKELEWLAEARPKQLPPSPGWAIWLILSGRGFGKTRLGAEWVRRKAWTMPGSIGHVIAPTGSDLEGTILFGESGLLATIPKELIKRYIISPVEIELVNGTWIRGFSATEPDRIRGPQSHWVWWDEAAACRYADEIYSNIVLSNRLPWRVDGVDTEPELTITTTPRPIPIIRDWLKRPEAEVRRIYGTTYENKKNLSKKFFNEIAQYEGTKLGDQEIHGKVLDPEDSGVVKRSWWRLWSANELLPVFDYIIISIDTALTEETFDKKSLESDFSAMSVWGEFQHQKKTNFMLLDCWEERLGFPDLVDKVKEEQRKRYGKPNQPVIKMAKINRWEPPAKTGGRKPDLILIEDIGAGKSLRQMLARERIFTAGYNPGKADKLARLHAVSHVFKGGHVWAVESKRHEGKFVTWAEPLVSQVCSYYGEGTIRHDDLMDTATQALRFMVDRVELKVDPVPVEPPEYEEAPRKRISAYGA